MTKEEIRNSTSENYIIFWDENPLKTTKGGAINSKGGIVLTAWVEELKELIYHRSNDSHGRKGFTINDNNKVCPPEIRKRLEYKINSL